MGSFHKKLHLLKIVGPWTQLTPKSRIETFPTTIVPTVTSLFETTNSEAKVTTELETIPLYTSASFYSTEELIYQKFPNPYAPKPDNSSENSGPRCIHCDAKNWDKCREIGKYARCGEGPDFNF